jgi:hypothetical protein
LFASNGDMLALPPQIIVGNEIEISAPFIQRSTKHAAGRDDGA